MKHKKTEQTICWSCAHATHNCPYHTHNTPIPHWDATSKPYGDTTTYIVHSCPQYIQDTEFLDYTDLGAHIAETLGCKLQIVMRKWNTYVAKYQKVTGRTLPEWALHKDLDAQIEAELAASQSRLAEFE